MSIRSGIIVIMKCFMVILAFNTLLGALTVAGAQDIALSAKLAAAGVVGVVLIPVLLIYWGAGWIVDFMTPKAEEARPETKIGMDDLQAIAFSAVGAFILYTAVRETVGLLGVLPRLSASDEAYIIQNTLRAGSAWFVGLYLLIGAPQLRRWIGSLRHAGQSRD